MSPDMVTDIIDVINVKGRSLLNEIAEDDGPPRPLAILSREFISDQDFPFVYTGFATTMLAQLRTLSADFDFYEKVLMQAFSLPIEIASPMAKKIETYDVLGGSEAAIAKLGWFKKVGMHLQEGIRRTVNFLPSLIGLNWENDQNQKYDIDYLYELSLLGKAVDDLMARARLMKGQASVALQMGVFSASDGSDIYGDVYGDPADASERQVLDTIRPLTGTPLPKKIFGGLSKLMQLGQTASESKLNGMVTSAGLSQDKTTAGQVTNPALRVAMDRILLADGSALQTIDGVDVTPNQLATAIELIKQARATGESGDAYDNVRVQYGDAVATNWRRGNIPGMMSNVMELAGDAYLSTGDAELDQAILGDVLQDNESLYGDTESDLDAEMGGLFSRARYNKFIKKGNRRKRKGARRMAKENRKDVRQQNLINAKAYANTEFEQPSTMEFDTDGGTGNFEPQGITDPSETPDDVYNVDQYFDMV